MVDDFLFRIGQDNALSADFGHYAIKDGQIIGHIGVMIDPSGNENVMEGIRIDPKHAGREVEHVLLKDMVAQLETMAQDPNIGHMKLKSNWSSDSSNASNFPVHELKAWVALSAELGDKVYKDDDGTYYYSTAAGIPLASLLAPKDNITKHVKPHNAHMAGVADEVYSKFASENFSRIEEGVCGVKGFVEAGGREWFTKTEKGGQIPEFDSVPMTRNEIAYNNVVNTAFSDQADHFVAKLRLSEDTLMAEKKELIDDSDKFEAAVLKAPTLELQQLAVINYIMGNKDRHSGNAKVDAQGKIILIDEGLSISDTPVSSRIPAYLQSHYTNVREVNAEQLTAYFSVDKKEQVKRELQDSDIDPDEVTGVMKRWDNALK